MTVNCLACGLSQKQRKTGITFHRFPGPGNPERRECWLKFVNKEDKDVSKYAVLCSQHFEESEFDKSLFKTILCSTAVPNRKVLRSKYTKASESEIIPGYFYENPVPTTSGTQPMDISMSSSAGSPSEQDNPKINMENQVKIENDTKLFQCNAWQYIKNEQEGPLFETNKYVSPIIKTDYIKNEIFVTDEWEYFSVKVESPTTEEIILKEEPATTNTSNIENNSYECTFCLHSFSSQVELESHKKKSHKRLFECEICNFRCSRKDNLQTHMLVHSDEKPFECESCDYKCSRKGDLQRHIRVHTGEKPYVCELCQYKCSQATMLQTHMRIHTGEKPFQCEICDYKCSQRSTLRNHMFVHTGEKPFECNICNKKLSRKDSLNKHIMSVHTGEKPLQCGKCDYKCARKLHLRIHMRIHAGEKPFECEICNWKCLQRTSLEVHMRVHTGEKPFQCEMCDYNCSRKSTLQRHARIHTAEKAFTCEICNIKYSRKDSLQKHKLAIHTKKM